MWMWRMHKFKLFVLSEGRKWAWLNCRPGKCREQFGNEEKNNSELDEDTDQVNRIYEFTAIPTFVVIIVKYPKLLLSFRTFQFSTFEPQNLRHNQKANFDP